MSNEAKIDNNEYKHKSISSLKAFKEECDLAAYNPDIFWRFEAHKHLEWFKKPQKVLPDPDCLTTGDIKWFEDGEINASYECLDRNIKAGNGNKVIYITEPNYPSKNGRKMYTYNDIYKKVNRLTNILRKHGIKKGDRVCVYLQMVIDLPVSMLACARIGAIHTVVFGGFSPQSLASRIDDLQCNAVITQDTGHRGEKYHIEMKRMVDDALDLCDANVEKVFIHEYTGAEIPVNDRDIFLSSEYGDPTHSHCEVMNAEDPLFVLYTSGSTGKPKGVVHTIGGFLVNAVYTYKLVYDPGDSDLQWICADIAWGTGHTYCVYAPLITGTTNLIFEGSINYPTPSRVWKIIEEHGVNIFQIAPTGLRLLLKYGDKYLEGVDLSSLNIVGSCGEPIKEPEWRWLKEKIGGGRCPLIDTWWQSETGACNISIIPGITPEKPGSLGYPMPGFDVCLVDGFNNKVAKEVAGNPANGSLYINVIPPSIMRTVYNDHDRFLDTYIRKNPGYFFTGDRASRDENGMYYVQGREDDTIQVSGYLVGTAEVEGAIQQVEGIAEAAIVSRPHDTKGECIIAYVVMKEGYSETNPNLGPAKVREHVKQTVSSFATPEMIVVVDDLPKTRSGKIMRRILRELSETGETSGDISTLINPECVEKIQDLVSKSNFFSND